MTSVSSVSTWTRGAPGTGFQGGSVATSLSLPSALTSSAEVAAAIDEDEAGGRRDVTPREPEGMPQPPIDEAIEVRVTDGDALGARRGVELIALGG